MKRKKKKKKKWKDRSVNKFTRDAHRCVFCAFTVKDDCVSDGENDMSRDTLVEEMLQQRDTAVIYPEAPEDERQREGSPEAAFNDENGTR